MLMSYASIIREKYDNAILSLRYLMKRKGLTLQQKLDAPHKLVDAFNSNLQDKEFGKTLKTMREKAPKAVEHLLRTIKRQVNRTTKTVAMHKKIKVNHFCRKHFYAKMQLFFNKSFFIVRKNVTLPQLCIHYAKLG